jgi:RimJ/RimL family protein N-acetyltransferase
VKHTVALREVVDADLDVFFAHYTDPVANRMAAFTHKNPNDRAAFDAHWAKIRKSAEVLIRTILADGEVVGHIASFGPANDRDVTYWIAREHWGKGLATRALAEFLGVEKTRPLHGRAAKDNAGSLRVLEKCGFQRVGEARGFANARGAEIDEVVFRLD